MTREEDSKKMEATSAASRYLTPRLTLCAEDFGRLSALVQATMSTAPDVAEVLSGELDRAHVLAAGRRPQDIVSMNSEVVFRDDGSERVHRMTLVYPADADVCRNRLSVLTPVGAALIGVRAGESITWETPSGQLRKLTVLSVKDP
ncbi:MAG TPA: nucleoside diphosphate kinase regulator [Pseudolabrys sp.]|jgi:regulator of nucleoside diphosphate kinase|nr:nucleoside diphosphate kinase regulator [Pseudolabrys sp.]